MSLLDKFTQLPIIIIGTLLLSYAYPAQALLYWLPANGDNIAGQIRIIQSKKGETLHKIARRTEMGFFEMAKANPKVSRYRRIRAHTAIVVPSSFILPDAPHYGIVVNLPEMRLYYYPNDYNAVITEPLAIGRPNWPTPTMETHVVERKKDPSWNVPDSIWKYSAMKGRILPNIMPPGPENPLGSYALRLAHHSILIHGTNQPIHIGKRISSGCLRMYPEDIEHLFDKVSVKTPVSIIDQPYKIGWHNNKLYLEAHLPLQENRGSKTEEENAAYYLITQSKYSHTYIDWKSVMRILAKHTGIPHQIGA